MNFQSTGGSTVKSVRCCVLFDRDSGTIHHVHRIVTMAGASESSKKQTEQRALYLAKDRGLDTKRLRILHVDDGALAPRTRYKVDPKTRTLVKEQPAMR